MDTRDTREGVKRRELIGSSLLLGARATGVRGSPPATQPASEPLPKNVLGRTGVKVTRLGMGAGFPSYERRLLEVAWLNGIRYFDNAYGYGNGIQENRLGDWVQRTGRRKDVFLVTKDGICPPDQFYQKVLRRLEALRVDTIDLMMIHNLEDPGVALDDSGEWRRLKERLVREGRIRFMGFSTHAEMTARIRCVTNAGRGGWTDVVMVACDPLMLRTNDGLNRALDTCVKAGVGLVAMKTTRGLGLKAAQRRGLQEGEARTEVMPGFDQLGLSAFGAVHHGMYSDGRFAVVCSAMLNIGAIEENARNARNIRKPLDAEGWDRLEAGMRRLTRSTCPDCDGACRRAAGARTDFCSIARYLAYYEEGAGNQARELFAALPPDQRDWAGADLQAASQACSAKLDFVSILERARRLLA